MTLKLTNSYCDGIQKATEHFQHMCPACGLWTIWEHRKTREVHADCDCISAKESEVEEPND